MTANLILGRVRAKKRNVDIVRRPRLEHRRRDGTVGGLVRHRERHAGKRGTPAPVLGARNAPQPLRPMHRRRAPVRIEPFQERAFVLAHCHSLEATLKPHQGFVGVRPAVDKIADPEKAVAGGVEVEIA